MFAAEVSSTPLSVCPADSCVGTFAVSVLGVFALAFAIEGVRRLVCPISSSYHVADTVQHRDFDRRIIAQRLANASASDDIPVLKKNPNVAGI